MFVGGLAVPFEKEEKENKVGINYDNCFVVRRKKNLKEIKEKEYQLFNIKVKI